MIEQISMFELLEPPTESRFTAEIKCGSGFENGRVRIFCASCNLGAKALANFLREEYGIGGHLITFPDGARGFADYNSKGIALRVWKEKESEKHSYVEAAHEIKRLILRDEYLTEEEDRKSVV